MSKLKTYVLFLLIATVNAGKWNYATILRFLIFDYNQLL